MAWEYALQNAAGTMLSDELTGSLADNYGIENPSRMVAKKLDMSLLKFPVRPRKQKKITLNEAIYLVHETCPRVMQTGVEAIIKACNEAFQLVKKWSARRASKQRQIGQ